MGIVGSLAAAVQDAAPRTLLLPCIAVALITLGAFQIRSWYRLRHIPGPLLASVSGAWMVKKALSGRFHEHLRNVSDKYGPLVRIGPNEVLSTDPEVLRMMSAARSPYTKGVFYETGRIIPGEETVVSLRDENAHRTLRAKMGTAFGGKENEGFGFGAGIDRQLMSFIHLIDTKYISTATEYRPVQFFRKASFFTLDVIGEVSFGDAFGFLNQDQDLYRYHEIHDESLPIMNIMGTMPWLARVLYRWPFRLLLPKEEDQVGFGRLMKFAKALIDKRLCPGAMPQRDMMQAFINNGMSRSELIQQVFVQILAGSVSSATAMCMTLLCLITTPTSYSNLRKEIDEAIHSDKLSSPVAEFEAKKLPYLQAVIREGLRMYPPVTGLGSKEVPKGGDFINHQYVPEGTQVGTNYFGLMHSKGIWGNDADVFRPERWLEAKEDQLKIMNGVVDLAFGYGKYSCLGKPIAMMELNKIFVELLRRYDFTIVNPQSPIKAWSAIFWVANDFWLRITRRE
ncbi:hypothetical protein TruAng_005246 [Truncatella angustata]|nr:hypothetical protein TruAng_005246 [Truncatella angustata]